MVRALGSSSRWSVLAVGLLAASCSSSGGDGATLAPPEPQPSAGASASGGGAGKGGASAKAGAAGAAGAIVVGGSGGASGAAGGKGGAAGEGGAAGQAGGAGASAGAGGGCGDGQAMCGGACRSLSDDPFHCGKCDNACPAASGSMATCVMGGCKSECKVGFGDCDGNAANGCESQLATDPSHCGSCQATACPAGPHGAPSCVTGKCQLSCDAGYLDCNGDPADGCEVDLKNDGANCGACAMSCGGAACVAGACECAGSAQTAKLLPLDMYVMMDQSGSMADLTSSGQRKWDAVRAALEGFLGQSPQGVSVGIQFFPIEPPGVPNNCSSNPSGCGDHGPCEPVKACSNPTPQNTIYPCSTSNDCKKGNGGPGGTCDQIGLCQDNDAFACPSTAIGQICSDGVNNYGPCVAYSRCVAQACVAADYAQPAVGIEPLPGVSGAIMATLAGREPAGGTPTAPALTGAVSYASQWASSHTDHVTIVVLATDGLPTDCSPTDIPSIAQIASGAAGQSPPIRTFVIGVFGAVDINAGAPGNLDQIAQAGGGTPQAFLVNTSQDVTAQFLAALETIRKSALGCSYQLPQPDPGQQLDFGKVNVRYTPGGGSASVLPGVADASQCPAGGGWYYDNAAAPTKVLLCPASCSAVSADTGAKVEIVLGCATTKP